ncbi:unnamed protein product [Caenorhabditis auriculariae]|uniref:Nucleotide-diphospho-sugar transferase domain-containing protein n=1 Tax=Caenorhabditis auriculariae TaxID=2777116 RepID=A0A8S1HEG0_9PELO|nr:unnamed protein product [Caenorhabditis auriculariae]
MDGKTRRILHSFYPELKIFTWHVIPLQIGFLPYDATYMSFFLMRTNMIQALLTFGKSFWMLQADTIWRQNLFERVDVGKFKGDILLDQQGYHGTSEARKKMMNGANFYLPNKTSTKELVASWLKWQRKIYITDPDLVKMFCLRGDFDCDYLPHSTSSGWEWIYGDQTFPPIIIQMDGETGGNKEKILTKYGFWFLDSERKCVQKNVDKAVKSLENGKVPKIISKSKQRETFYLKIGEIMNRIPIFLGIIPPFMAVLLPSI